MTKKKVAAIASGATVAIALAVGSGLLNSTPVTEYEVPPQEETVIVEPTTIPVPSFSPMVSPTATPEKTLAPSEKPRPTEKPVSTLEMFGISGDIVVEGTYTVKEIDENRSAFSIAVPKKLSADIYELYLNGQFVDKQLLPGKIIAPPVVFTVPELLEVRLFKLQEVIAVGRLEGKKLDIAVKDGVMDD
ncbi:MAG: hypothetical protein BWY15_00411 [Firmicutes bacterium ADurb.Bin193]|nr:MAG: hypothetical protein BWY15_00411 [Firmicutes bacterium ADurb.Bin193]